MSNDFTLDDIAAAAQEKFGDVRIPLGGDEVAVLRHPIRLSKAERAALQEFGEKLGKVTDDDDEAEGEDDLDMIEVLRDAYVGLIKLILDPEGASLTKLAKAISVNGTVDFAKLQTIVDHYQSKAQMGEASA